MLGVARAWWNVQPLGMNRRIFIAIFSAFWILAGSAVQAGDKPATSVVEDLHKSLLTMMKKADVLGFEGRREFMEPVVARSFNMQLIAAMASGKNWDKFDDRQKQELIDALKRLSVATYAARFDGYSGEEFQIIAEKPMDQGLVFVNTELYTSDGGVIALNYLMHPGKAGWRIVDVYFLGAYSELGMRRSEYAAVYARDGFDGLITSIEQKISDYAEGLAQ